MLGWTNWKDRERKRFSLGVYAPLPDLGFEFPADHFLHLALNQTNGEMLIAYTPNEKQGLADRQVRMRFGRYLAKEHPCLTQAAIKGLVNIFYAGTADQDASERSHVKIVHTYRRIVEAYKIPMYARDASSSSCMIEQGACLAVYAQSPDVGLAVQYDADEEPIARSVVSLLKHGWLRTYTAKAAPNEIEHIQFKAKMLEAGYKEELISLRGHRLSVAAPISALPYLDGDDGFVYRDGGFWIVTDEESVADYRCKEVDGVGAESRQCPFCCDNFFGNDGDLCAPCSENTTTCVWCGTRVFFEDASRDCTGEIVCEACCVQFRDGSLHHDGCSHTDAEEVD